MTLPKAALRWLQPVTALRIAIIVTMLASWEALAASGLLYRDVVPSLLAIGKALFNLLTVPDMPIDLDRLAATLEAFPRSVRVAFEPRHTSWYTDEIGRAHV